MSLNVEQIQQLLKKPKSKEKLKQAERHEARLRLHCESNVETTDNNPAFKDFTKWVASILPKDKFKRFSQLIKTPYVTSSLTDEIWTELARVFDGQNAFFNYEFKTLELQNDFQSYLANKIKDRQFFRTKGFDNLKNGINSVLIVDLPTEQTTPRPEPFYYFVNSCDIEDVCVKLNGQIDYIIFEISEELYGAYDDEFFRVFQETKEGVYTLLSESKHDLGYCPASFFWDKNIKKDCNILKKSPITDSLSSLDRYLAQDTFKEHADLYSSFPIVVSMERQCGYDGCENGWVNNEIKDYDIVTEQYVYTNQTVKCPSCGERELVGAGTNFEYPAPQTSESPDLSNPVSIVSASIEPLNYLTEKLAKLAAKIKTEVIGGSSELVNKTAINEAQVIGGFEGRRNVLMSVKESFETIHKFANDTLARLRYGANFISSTVFYGDEFYLKTAEDLQLEYEAAKKNGEPDEEIDAIYKQIIQTKYKGNSERIDRAWILYNLNPLPHYTSEQAKTLLDAGALNLTDFVIKIRFNTFIARFEREQTSIIYFADQLPFDQKINKIYEQLKIYANESKQS